MGADEIGYGRAHGFLLFKKSHDMMLNEPCK
jgi:hypothetical protein